MDYKKLGLTLLILLAGCSAILILVENRLYSRTAFLTLLCLSLWLTELIPLYATTFLLLAGIPFLLGSIESRFALKEVLYWPANPVIPLFFGGFTLSVAGRKYGIDAYIGRLLLKLSRGNRSALLAVILLGTAILSMWMSNIAAAAMMIVVLRPIWRNLDPGDRFRKAALLSLAFGANFGGMATPIGSGPAPPAPLFFIGLVYHEILMKLSIKLFLLLLLCVFIAKGAPNSDENSSEPKTFLRKYINFSEREIRSFQTGQIIMKILSTKERREVAIFGGVRIRATPEFFIRNFKQIVQFKKHEAVLQIGKFSDPPVEADVMSLTLDPKDVKAIKECEIGQCDIKLSADAIREFRNLNWEAPDAPMRVHELARRDACSICNELSAGREPGAQCISRSKKSAEARG